MEMTKSDIHLASELARRAYEYGRFKKASLFLLWVAPLTALSILYCGRPSFSATFGGFLAVATVFFWWRGQMLGKGAVLGAMVGTIAASIPIASHIVGICCVYDIELGLCVASGLIAGALVSTRAAKVSQSKTSYLIAAGTVVILSGALGCAVLGMSGLWAFIIGLAFVSTPILTVAHLRTA